MLSMEPIRDPEVLARMRIAFDLYEAAEEIMRQNLRRRHPEATEEEIERDLVSWLREQPVRPRRSLSSRFGRGRGPGE
jgi:hypothetical protein